MCTGAVLLGAMGVKCPTNDNNEDFVGHFLAVCILAWQVKGPAILDSPPLALNASSGIVCHKCYNYRQEEPFHH